MNEGKIVSKDKFKDMKLSQSMPKVEADKSQTLNSLIFKNQFNHRGMIRKPKTEGRPEVEFINIGSQCV